METVSSQCTNNKYDREDIIQELSQIYEKHREEIASTNGKEMERLEKMCKQEVKRGKIVQLKSEEYPRLYKDSFLFEHFLKKRGFKLLSMTNEHAVCHLEDYTIIKLYEGPLEDVFVKK